MTTDLARIMYASFKGTREVWAREYRENDRLWRYWLRVIRDDHGGASAERYADRHAQRRNAALEKLRFFHAGHNQTGVAAERRNAALEGLRRGR